MRARLPCVSADGDCRRVFVGGHGWFCFFALANNVHVPRPSVSLRSRALSRLSTSSSPSHTVLSFFYYSHSFQESPLFVPTPPKPPNSFIMDRNVLAFAPTTADDLDAADRKRLDGFKLGSVAPRSANRRSAPVFNHARSHSRKDSSLSTIPSVISLPSIPSLSSVDTPPTSPSAATSSKRNSHHRRRSSVSTRHESAEIMGVSLPSIPVSLSDDNINLGDKDSVRRRALWALEGRSDMGSFSKVAIPELGSGTPEQTMSFGLRT